MAASGKYGDYPYDETFNEAVEEGFSADGTLWEAKDGTIVTIYNYDQKPTIQIVRDFDGTYYANAFLWEKQIPLPEYVTYRELKSAIKRRMGVLLPKLTDLKFICHGRKEYAQVQI